MIGVQTMDIVDQVLHRIDIVTVVSRYVQLNRRGKEWLGLCPFHEERTPSFTVSPDKQMFYCFGCQVGGNALTFVRKKEGLEFREALEVLAREAGVSIPERFAAAPGRPDERKSLYEVLEAAADLFEKQLRSPAGAQARAYLAGRGIDEDTQREFRLGFALRGWRTIEQGLRRFDRKRLAEAGLIVVKDNSDRYYDRFRGRIMFPIADHAGRVVGFGGRALSEEDEPKYLNSSETAVFNKRRLWYGFDRARSAIAEAGSAIVVEGYLDLIATHQAGFNTAVASLGTALSSEQVMVLSRLARQVVITFDADAAGEKATLRGLNLFRRHGARVLVCMLPDGEDPDSLISKRGQKGFSEYLEAALPLFDYRLSLVVPEERPGPVEEKMVAVQKVLPILLDIDDEVELDQYVGEVAIRLGIDKSALLREVGRKRSRDNGGAFRNNNQVKQDRGNLAVNEIAAAADSGEMAERRLEQDLVRMLLHDPDAARLVKDRLDLECMTDQVFVEIVKAVMSSVEDDNEGFIPRVMSRVADEQARAVVGELALCGEYVGSQAVVLEFINVINSQPERKRLTELQEEIMGLERRGRPVTADLIMEMDRLLRKLKNVT